MSVSCEKDFSIFVPSLEWALEFGSTPPSVTDITSLSNRFAIQLTSGYSPLDNVSYLSELIGPFPEIRNITVAGSVNLNSTEFHGPVVLLDLRLHEAGFVSTLVDASITKSSAQVPFVGPCGFNYALPIGQVALIRAGLVARGVGAVCSVDFTVSVTIP